MSDKTTAVVTTKTTWGGRRPGAGRPRKSAIATGKPEEQRARRVEVIRETQERGAIAMTTPHGVRIEGLTLEQLMRLLGALT